MSKGVNRQLYAIAHLQFVEYVVVFDGGFGNCQTLSALGVAKASSDMTYALGFAAD
jgi:hypothetical protein